MISIGQKQSTNTHQAVCFGKSAPVSMANHDQISTAPSQNQDQISLSQQSTPLQKAQSTLSQISTRIKIYIHNPRQIIEDPKSLISIGSLLGLGTAVIVLTKGRKSKSVITNTSEQIIHPPSPAPLPSPMPLPAPRPQPIPEPRPTPGPNPLPPPLPNPPPLPPRPPVDRTLELPILEPKLHPHGVKALNSNDLKILFPDGIQNLHIRQQDTGDCYLLAAIYDLSRRPKGRKYLQNLFVGVSAEAFDRLGFPVAANAVDHNTVIKRVWHLKFPSWPEEIKVEDGELHGQRVYSEKYKRWVYKYLADSDSIGVQAIERAYGRLRRLRGEGAIEDRTVSLVESGWGYRAANDITGCQKYACFQRYDSNSLNEKIRLTQSLGQKLQDPRTRDNYSITCGTSHNMDHYDSQKYRSQGLLSNHAYAVEQINLRSNLITLINPHNTKNPLVLPIDVFARNFDGLQYVYLGS